MAARSIALIACSSAKLDHPAPAGELYQGALFRKSLAYVQHLGVAAADTRILSALHGVLPLDRAIEPYNVTLNTMNRAQRVAWGRRVARDLTSEFDLETTTFTFLAGMAYRSPITEALPRLHTRAPLAGMRIGHALQWLDAAVQHPAEAAISAARPRRSAPGPR